jgi:hypothetical protein
MLQRFSRFWSVTIPDDAGVQREVFDHGAKEHSRNPLLRDVVWYLSIELADAYRPRNASFKLSDLLWMFPTAMFLLSWNAFREILGPPQPWHYAAFGVMLWVLALCSGLLVGRLLRAIRKERRAALLLRVDRCPACAHTLGSEMDAGGLVKCSGCEAKWRAERCGHQALTESPSGLMMGGKNVVRDADDVPRCVASLAAMRQDESARGISEAVHAATFTLRLLIASFVLLAGAVLCATMIANPAQMGTESVSPYQIAAGIVVGVGGLVVSVLVFTGRLGVGTSARVDTLLKHGHCPSCLAAFQAADVNGITTCSKCWVRWRCRWVMPRAAAAGAE